MVDGLFGEKQKILGDLMRVLAIISAGGGSKGILLKNLVKLGGRPLLYYTLKAALDSSVIGRTVVSTDNDKIARFTKKMGAEVIHRPKKLSGNKIGLEPSIIHVLNYLERNEDYIPDIIITLQNTSPFRTAKHINDAFSLLKKGKYDSIVSVFVSHDLIWNCKNEKCFPNNYNLLNRPNRQQMKNQFIENGAIYITKYSLLKKNKCRISGRIGLYKMPVELSIQIDCKHDLLLSEQIMRNIRCD